MIELSEDQRQELDRGGAVRARDPRTNTTYVLVREDLYARLQALLEEDFTPRDAYPAIDSAFREGWDGPEMAQYDRYEEHRP